MRDRQNYANSKLCIAGLAVSKVTPFESILVGLQCVSNWYKNSPIGWVKPNAAPLKFDPKPSAVAFSAVFRTPICRPVGASDAISDAVVEWVGMDDCEKFGNSRSKWLSGKIALRKCSVESVMPCSPKVVGSTPTHALRSNPGQVVCFLSLFHASWFVH